METTEVEINEASAKDVVDVVRNLSVVDGRTYELMANGVLLLRKARKYFEARSKPLIEEAWKHYKHLGAQLAEDLKPIDEAQKYGDKQLADYDDRQEKARKAEQLRLEAEKKEKDEQERLELAALAEQLGAKTLADSILTTPSNEPPPVVYKDVPKVEGLSFREDWRFEIVDPGAIPLRFHRLEANSKLEWSCKCVQDIANEVKRLKSTARIPGVRVYSEKVPVGRG
jgi:hypothetical protein